MIDATVPFLERAATWATSLSRDDIPESVERAAMAQRASTLGAAIWTATHPVGSEISEATQAQYASGDATFLAPAGRSSEQIQNTTGRQPAGDADLTAADTGLTPAGAVYGNAALSMALDFDDTVLGGHTGHSAVFTALAYAQAHDTDQETALCAQVAANEIAARVASAAAIGPFRGQQTTYVHALGATVARAVVADDDADTLANSLGLALGQPPWPLDAPFFGSDAKHWLGSEAARSGLSALDAARSGQQGNTATIEATTTGGFLEEFARIPLPAFLDGLGDRWHTRAVTVKAVPGCAYVTAPVEAAVQIAESADLSPEEIDSVTVRGSLFATEVNDRASPFLDGPESPLSALTFTIPYNVAAALADGEQTPRQLTPDRVNDPTLWDLANRVEVVHDDSFTLAALESEVPIGAMLRRVGWPVVLYSAKTVGLRTTLANLPTLARFVRKRPLPTDLADADKRMGAHVEVTAGGRTYVATVDHPQGFAGHDLDDIEAVAREKYREALIAGGASDDEAAETVSQWFSIAGESTLPALVPGGPRANAEDEGAK